MADLDGVIDLFPTRIFKFRIDLQIIEDVVKHKKKGGESYTIRRAGCGIRCIFVPCSFRPGLFQMPRNDPS